MGAARSRVGQSIEAHTHAAAGTGLYPGASQERSAARPLPRCSPSLPSSPPSRCR